MKGVTVLSDTILNAITIVISLILVVLIVNIVFSQKTLKTSEELYKSVARDIATSLDTAIATAGSAIIEQEIPKRTRLDLTIDYKTVFIAYDGKTIRKLYSGLIEGGPYSFKNPDLICIVKTKNDGKLYIMDKACSCNPSNSICDPECNIEGECDSVCYSNIANNVCNTFCVRNSDGVCDPDCYRNDYDGVFDRDCISSLDGICDPDTNWISDAVCDSDCSGINNVCDPDCSGDQDCV